MQVKQIEDVLVQPVIEEDYEQFGAGFDSFMLFDLFDEDAFAFRAGADGDAVLPSIFSDL